MSSMLTIVLIVQVVSALSIIVLVLLQQGKGADMGSAFGTGSAGSLFGASGAANFLSRATKWAAVIFFASTAALAWMGHRGGATGADSGLMQNFTPADRSVPTAPGAVPPPAGSSVPGAGTSTVPAAPAAPSGAAVPAAPATGGATVPSAPAPATAPAPAK
ncbi:preprotein translocase subunit SecG [Schauerella aestuarii]|uniref:preprotein translocase subunit SecG n=1 Tax=Schauerella aestuarii TaxID=2511204 RepID=UPI001367F864|nr:preprotein translocase subunit SecG [Achromobacter aestuarii]MYZ43052.1 preprotein translocase subunit SecG [Achromobacter aestuarii]